MSLHRLVNVALLVSAGCLDPITSDTPSYSTNILPSGADVQIVADGSALAESIRGSDGVTENPVARRPGFVAGTSVFYWDYGTATRYAITEYRLHRCGDDGLPLPAPDDDIGHPPIIDQVPGDPAYGHLFRIWIACVTDRYDFEQLPSRQALVDAVALGLVDEPYPTSGVVHMPVLAPDVELAVAPDVTVAPADVAYYRGVGVLRFSHGGTGGAVITLPGSSTVLRTGRVYKLKKAGDATYAETVFSTPRRMGESGHPNYTPIWRVVTVTMNAAFVPGSATSEAALFTVMGTTLTPVHPNLTSFVMTDQYVNNELQFEEGSP